MLILVYLFLFHALKIGWLMKDTIPIGWDIPYHVANYFDLKEILLPHFQLSGWSDASFGGFQLFQGYPIFPFIIILFFDIFLASSVAFKWVIILGAVGLPLATYWTLWQSKVSRPGPIFGAILSLAYLFHDDHFAFGGNLRSVFSGEFAHSLSITLLVIFCGFLYKAMENKKYIPHAIILLALVGFTHPVSFAVAIFLPFGFLIGSKMNDTLDWIDLWWFMRLSRVGRITLVAGLFFCLWAVGFYINTKFFWSGNYTIVSREYGWGITFDYLIPKLLLPFGITFLSAVIYYCFQWRKLSQIQVIFLWWFFLSLSLFLIKFMGFAIRFLPLVYLFVMLFLAATMGQIYVSIRREITYIGLIGYMIASVVFIFYYVETNNLFSRYQWTSGHNFIGAESRSEWNSVKLSAEFLSNKFDSQTEYKTVTNPPRIFTYFKWDLFRVLTKASIYDSLFSSSAFNESGIWTWRQIDKQKISAQQFWNYMDLSNTKIVVWPKELTDHIEKVPAYFTLIKVFDQYKIFETNNTSPNYVVPIGTDIYMIHDLEKWKKISQQWYETYSHQSPYVVYEPDLSQTFFSTYNDEKTSALQDTTDCNIKEFVSRERIKIHTECIWTPLLIKFAYHQNWKVTGADKIYLTTPAFMMIIPQQEEIVLYYGKRPYNYITYALWVIGLLLFFTYGYIEKIFWQYFSYRTKNYKKYRALYKKMDTKYHLSLRGNILIAYSVPTLCVAAVLLSIMLVYVNKG